VLSAPAAAILSWYRGLGSAWRAGGREPSLAEAGAALAAVEPGEVQVFGPGAKPWSHKHPAQASARPVAHVSALRHLAGAGVLWENKKGEKHKTGLVPLRFILATGLCCVNYQGSPFENLVLLFLVFSLANHQHRILGG